jgi:hypothetical protein
MKLLQTIVTFALIGLSIASGADDISIQLVQGDGRKKSDYRAEVGGIVVLRVAVQNRTSSPITVGYIGAGSGAFLAKVQDRDIDPASEAMFTVIVDNDSLGVPSSVELAVGYTIDKQLKTDRAVVTLASASVVSFSPGFLTWKVGDALEEKSATLSVPAQTKVIRAPEVDGFVIRMEGDKIFVKPVRTDKPLSAGVRLNTAPNMRENRMVPLFLSIAP